VLTGFATAALARAGLECDAARATAETLVEGELFGSPTHGLVLLPYYVAQVEEGRMACAGRPRIVSQSPSAQVWDGKGLSGSWLVRQAIDVANDLIVHQAVVTIVVHRSHHIGCLGAHVRAPAERGMFVVLAASNSGRAAVAPAGGSQPVLSTNPIAAGIPTDGQPIIMDMSTSAISEGQTSHARRRGERLTGPWLIDRGGITSDDPSAAEIGVDSAILPLGAPGASHKGFALALLVEALTAGLGGFGRADQPTPESSAFFLQMIDPQAFGGAERFRRQTSAVAELCRGSRPIGADRPVRMPGERAMANRRATLRDGVMLDAQTANDLAALARRLGIAPLAASHI
jgi:LDH2 family malate/lactate/ureidoglycolate dehydrogenase